MKPNVFAKRLLDFILVASLLSALVIYGLVHYGKIDPSNMQWVFMPGYCLMFVILLMTRISLGGAKGGPDA